MSQYKCAICGYIYEPDLGDPDGGVAVGSLFQDIDGGWACPICGATKDQFEEEDD